MLAAMSDQVGLAVAVHVQPLHAASTRHRRLEDRRPHGAAAPRHLPRQPYVHREQPHCAVFGWAGASARGDRSCLTVVVVPTRPEEVDKSGQDAWDGCARPYEPTGGTATSASLTEVAPGPRRRVLAAALHRAAATPPSRVTPLPALCASTSRDRRTAATLMPTRATVGMIHSHRPAAESGVSSPPARYASSATSMISGVAAAAATSHPPVAGERNRNPT